MSQKKVKFNIVDIIVILLLVAGIAFVGIKMLGSDEKIAPTVPETSNGITEGTEGTYHITFSAECIPGYVADTLVKGSRSENVSRNMDLGTLIDFSVAPSIIYSFDANGICVQSEKPGYVSVTLVCEVTGIQQPTGLQVGQFMLNIGHGMGVRCGNTEINTIVRDITPAAAD